MAATDRVSMAGFDFPLWCGRLSAALQFVLDHEDDLNRRTIAKETLAEYDAALTVKLTGPPVASNVVPLFSIHDAIDEVLPS